MAEGAVSFAIKSTIQTLGGEWWSTESGYQIQTNKEGVAIPRKGGTRTTPGWPDIAAHMPLFDTGLWYSLTVEAKSSRNAISPAQWDYARKAAAHGMMHFICRSPDEFLTGLSYMRLLPERPWEYDPQQWPHNLNFLPEQGRRFWALHWHPVGDLRWQPGPLPENTRPR